MILILISYLAGILTILSPCILPVLPFVFSRAQGPFHKTSLPLLAGMSLTFPLLSALALIGGEWVGHANSWGRGVALVLMALFGLSLLFPHLSEAAFAPLTRLGSKIGRGSKSSSLSGSFLIGVSTGFLWAPCAGPILGLVLTGAAAQGNTARSALLLFAYSMGAATSLALALVAGNRFLGTLKGFLGVDQVVKKCLGAAVLLGVIAIAFNLDRTLLTKISKVETTSTENKLLAFAGLERKAEDGKLDLSGATAWLNSKPLTLDDLRGKVVMVDFWTYSCINCLRTLPFVKAWNENYKDDGLVILGIHTPEFPFEKDQENVRKAVNELGITYPVVLDNDYKIWNSMHNQSWPAHYFIDREGVVRHSQVGEGYYAEAEEILRKLLSEGGHTLADGKSVAEISGIGRQADFRKVLSPETYIGYSREQNFASPEDVADDEVAAYTLPESFKPNEWALAGKWKVEAQRAVAKAAQARIVFRFHARDVHLVLGTPGAKIKFKVKIDGKAPGEDHGLDVDASGAGVIDSHRLFQLIRQKESDLTDRNFEIEFESPEAEAYAFTFG